MYIQMSKINRNSPSWQESLPLSTIFEQTEILLEIRRYAARHERILRRARSLVVSDLRSETKGSRFESGC